jgi:hypothetical protein
LAGLAAVLCGGILAAACSSSPSGSNDSTKSTSHHPTHSKQTTTTQATSSTTTSAAAVGSSCPTVTATAGGTQGAAGTIVGTVTLTNPGPGSCVIFGYPTLYRYSASGSTVPVDETHGITVNVGGSANQPASTVTLTTGEEAEFTYQYSDVPTNNGNESTCPTSTMMSVGTPGVADTSSQFPLTMSPCSEGQIYVSPIYAASSSN